MKNLSLLAMCVLATSCGDMKNPFESHDPKCKKNCDSTPKQLTSEARANPRASAPLDLDINTWVDLTLEGASRIDQAGLDALLQTNPFFLVQEKISQAILATQVAHEVTKAEDNKLNRNGQCIKAVFSRPVELSGRSISLLANNFGRCFALTAKGEAMGNGYTRYLTDQGLALSGKVTYGDRFANFSELAQRTTTANNLDNLFPLTSLAESHLTNDTALAEFKVHFASLDRVQYTIARGNKISHLLNDWDHFFMGQSNNRPLTITIDSTTKKITLDGTMTFMKGKAYMDLADKNVLDKQIVGELTHYIFDQFTMQNSDINLGTTLGFKYSSVLSGQYAVSINGTDNFAILANNTPCQVDTVRLLEEGKYVAYKPMNICGQPTK